MKHLDHCREDIYGYIFYSLLHLIYVKHYYEQMMQYVKRIARNSKMDSLNGIAISIFVKNFNRLDERV